MTEKLRIFLLSVSVLSCIFGFCCHAQSGGEYISGVVMVENETAEPAIQAAVELLSVKDSVRVDVAVTDADGRFSIPAEPGDYIVRISYVGYMTKTINVHHTVSKIPLTLDTITLVPDSELLKGAVVEAKVDPVRTEGDTTIFNAAAYPVSEDAMLEDLMKKIPGLTVEDNGAVFINGKEIKQIFVNGKKYFGGDLLAGLQNIPANMVENIRAYERQSDFARQTGIEDGEEVTVLDIGVKKTMFDGMQGNVNSGAGTSSRYTLKASGNSIKEDTQKTILISQNNINARSSSVSSAKNLGGGASGELMRRELGFTYADETKTREMNGHLHYSASRRDASNATETENILQEYTNFVQSSGSSASGSNNVRGDYQVTWRPSKYWTWSVKPAFSVSWNESGSRSGGSTWREKVDSLLLNTTRNASSSKGKAFSESLQFIASHRFEKPGRSLSLLVYESFANSSSGQHSDNHTYLYNQKTRIIRDSTVRIQDIVNASDNFTAALQLSYSEPLSKTMLLQLTCREDFRSNYSLRDVFGSDGLRRPSQSSEGTYQFLSTSITANWRYYYRRVLLTVGAMVKPQNTFLSYLDEEDKITKTKLYVMNVAPNVTFRFRESKARTITFNYRSFSGLPSVYNLIPVANGANPLNIHIGNPDLKPSFTQRLNFSYNNSPHEKHRSLVFNVNYSNTANAISNSTVYDPDTGGRTVTPKNISGNWSLGGNTVFSKTFSDKRFSMSNHMNASYANNKAYLYNRTLKEDETNIAQRYAISDNIEGSFRNEWLETVLNLGGSYRVERSLLRPAMNREPYNLNAGLSTVVTIPDVKTRFNVDFYYLHQKGYGKQALDRDYRLLNAGISQPVLKGKGSLRLDAYDILRDMRNQTTSFTAERRSVSVYNGINSYVILRFIYRFKI